MNVRTFPTFRVEKNKYMGYVTLTLENDIC